MSDNERRRRSYTEDTKSSPQGVLVDLSHIDIIANRFRVAASGDGPGRPPDHAFMMLERVNKKHEPTEGAILRIDTPEQGIALARSIIEAVERVWKWPGSKQSLEALQDHGEEQN